LPRFFFPIELNGLGETPEQAWMDAVEGFCQDDGGCPEEYRMEKDEEEE